MSTVDSRVPTHATVLDLVRSCHPQPAFAVSAMAALLALSASRGPQGTVAVFAAVLAGQLSVGWCNDYLDAGRDASTGRTDKPVAAGRISRRVVGAAALLALAATVPLSLLSGLVPGLLHIAAVLSAWAYNLWLKFSPLSVLPYLVSFGLLPAFVVTGLPGHPAPTWWLVLAGALLGGAAHFANVLPDLADDLATGVRGLPHRLGRSWSALTALALLLAASAVLAVGATGIPSVVRILAVPTALVAGLVGLRRGRRPGSRAAFTAVIAVAGLDVLLLVLGAR